jgi:hypothetical protein
VPVYGNKAIGVRNVEGIAIAAPRNFDPGNVPICRSVNRKSFATLSFDIEPGMEMIRPEFTHVAGEVIDLPRHNGKHQVVFRVPRLGRRVVYPEKQKRNQEIFTSSGRRKRTKKLHQTKNVLSLYFFFFPVAGGIGNIKNACCPLLNLSLTFNFQLR